MQSTLDQIDKNSILKDFVERRSGEEFLVPLRQAENVRERIRLNTEIGELKPIQKKLERLLSTRGKWAQDLEKEINALNLEGMNIALRQTQAPVEGTSYYAPTKQVSSGGNPLYAKVDVPPSTKRLIEELISLPSSDIKRIQKKIGTREKNLAKLMDEIVKLSDEFTQVKDTIVADRIKRGDIKDTTTVPEDMDTINVYRDGIKEEYAVPKPLAVAIKNPDAQKAHWAFNLFFAVPTKAFKAAVVSLNSEFFLINPTRDISDALFGEATENGFKQSGKLLQHYTSALAAAAKMDGDWELWRKSGAGSSTFLAQEMGSKPEKMVERFSQTGGVRRLVKGPDALLSFLTRTTEEVTRVAKFMKDLSPEARQAIESGLIPYAQLPKELRETAFATRNITLDFARMGQTARILNQMIPFFNVAIQGSARMVNLAKDNPARFTATMLTYVGLPAVMVYLNNSRFEDFNDLSEYERKGNVVVLYGDRTEEERAINAPLHAVKMPLGNLAQPFYNIVENFFDFVAQRNPQGIIDLALDVGEDLSPIGMPIGNERLRRSFSTILPPQFRVPAQLIANKDFYTGMPIEPEYIEGERRADVPDAYREGYYTGPTTRLLGQLTGKIGLSPAELDNIIATTTGGLGKTMVAATDTLGGEPPENISQVPVARRFFGPKGGQIARDEREQEKAIEQQIQKETWEGTPVSLAQQAAAAEASSGLFSNFFKKKETENSSSEPALPSTTPELKVLLDDAVNVLEGYEKKKTRLTYSGETSPTKIKRDLQELEAERVRAQEIKDLIEQKYPGQVREITLEIYGKGTSRSVEERGDWAWQELGKVTTKEEAQALINTMWEKGVLTTKSTGVAAYIKEVYGIDVSQYTGTDEKIKKMTGSSGDKKEIPKLSVNIPGLPKISTVDLGKGISTAYKPLTPVRTTKTIKKLPTSTTYKRASTPKVSLNIPAPVTSLSGLGRVR